MNDFINFDCLNAGDHFMDDLGRCFIKLNTRNSSIDFCYRDVSYDRYGFNALDYNGLPVLVPHEAKFKKLNFPGRQKTETGYTFETENQLLWNFVKLVATECECQCGNPPFDNGNPCPACFALQFRTTMLSPTESEELEIFKNLVSSNVNPSGLKKVIDTQSVSDKVEESELKNKQIETTTTNKMKQTFNTLKEAVVAAINELKNNGTLSVHQITTLIREKTNKDEWEVNDCVARQNNQNIKFWINHDDVRRIVNDMYATQELDSYGCNGRNFNGQFNEYLFQPVNPNTATVPGVPATVLPPTTTAPSDITQRVDGYVKNQKSLGFFPTMKRIQSAIKVNGITCGDFVQIVSSLGYKVVNPGSVMDYSKYYVA